MWIWRIAWHAGFGGTGTAETANPVKFIRKLREKFGRLDWVSPYGAYQVDSLSIPLNLNTIRNGKPKEKIMPYHVGKSGKCPTDKPWAVIKDTTGEVMGCHPSKAKAEAQMAALYANEPNLKGRLRVTNCPPKPIRNIDGENPRKAAESKEGNRKGSRI